jgi:hypothetical protein
LSASDLAKAELERSKKKKIERKRRGQRLLRKGGIKAGFIIDCVSLATSWPSVQRMPDWPASAKPLSIDRKPEAGRAQVGTRHALLETGGEPAKMTI